MRFCLKFRAVFAYSRGLEALVLHRSEMLLNYALMLPKFVRLLSKDTVGVVTRAWKTNNTGLRRLNRGRFMR